MKTNVSIRRDINYNPAEIEARWGSIWQDNKVYQTSEPQESQQTFYCLDFFPYPSGAGLSVGHGRNYVPSDVIARYHRMKGDAVLHPMGWDAFGLPAENEAIKKGIHPMKSTTEYAAHYKHQLNLMGCSYDWEREINSSNPAYYKWNQYMFLMLFEKGLAYRKVAPVNWCAHCQTVLAAEEIENGLCWRCHNPMVIVKRKQWFLKVTHYAEELHASLDLLDWPEHILTIQRNWIGRSEGVEIELQVPQWGVLDVFTTRVDTLFGTTFLVMSSEHPQAERIPLPAYQKQVTAYIYESAQRSMTDHHTRIPDGVPTGRFIKLPWGTSVPLYIADYVLGSHGTGIVMGVPAHDNRDYLFAQKYNIPVIEVVQPVKEESYEIPYTEYGVLVNSQQFTGMTSVQAQQAITDWLMDRKIGERKVHFRLKDWLISRQRYWGTPIPIIHCTHCGEVAVPAASLPVLLPSVPDYKPRGDGRSPLANESEFVHTHCPKCGRSATRETDTMTGFVCSSWYYMRFVDPHNDKAMFDPLKAARWLPVDLYVGGEEHAVGHLLYSRFWTKFLADAGVISFREPFPVLRSQGVLHVRDAETGRIERMSKSKGNVVTPESVIREYGADILRLHLLFMGPFEANVVWDTETDSSKPQHIEGVRRFLHRVWRLVVSSPSSDVNVEIEDTALLLELNETIKAVTDRTEALHFHMAISALMTFSSTLEQHRLRYGDSPAFIHSRLQFIKLLAPFAPFITEELWSIMGEDGSIHHTHWPERSKIRTEEDKVVLPVQLNGKFKTRISVPPGMDSSLIEEKVTQMKAVKTLIGDRSVKRIIVVPRRVINIVVE